MQFAPNELTLPCYINGKMIFQADSTLSWFAQGGIHVIASRPTKWMVEAAFDAASRAQMGLKKIPFDKLCQVLVATAQNYFKDASDYELFVRLTGSPFEHIYKDLEALKVWAAECESFYQTVLSKKGTIARQTAPVVVILPDNSDEEAIFVLTQALLSRNAVIVRPSTRNDGGYASILFVQALNKAIDQQNDPELEFLRGSVSILNLHSEEYVTLLAVDGWNYVLFGDDSTARVVEDKFKELNINPRKIFAYGTGLSSSVVMSDFDFTLLPHLAESIFVNRGNECFSTDLIYVHSSIEKQFTTALIAELAKFKSGEPFEKNRIGLVPPSNIDFIEEQMRVRGKQNVLKIETYENGRYLHPSLIILHEFESAMEYPGPVASLRAFENIDELARLIKKDLNDNKKTKSLVTSVYTKESFESILPVTSAYTVRCNLGTHEFDPMKPHQGLFLLRELSDLVFLEK